MAPGLFTTARLPSRTPPAPSGITSSSLSGPQRRSLSCRAHAPASRAPLIDVSTTSSSAQLHYVSADEEDNAHASRVVAVAATATVPAPVVLEATAAAASADAEPLQQQHSTPSTAAPAAVAAPAATAAAAAAPAPVVVVAAVAAAAAAAHASCTASPAKQEEQQQQQARSASPSKACSPAVPSTPVLATPAPVARCSASSSSSEAAAPAEHTTTAASVAQPLPSTSATETTTTTTTATTAAAAAHQVAAPAAHQQLPSTFASVADVDARSDARLSVAACSSAPSGCRDHNCVTIKANTNVKDAAGAVVKVLGRLPNVLVTALRMESAHEALNRAVKSIAVARKYLTDEHPESELSFLPINRSNAAGLVDPNLFAFLCFKTQLAKGLQLLEQDKTDLNVSRASNANAMANAIIRILKERGQAVMKAGGSEAIFIAMSAVVNARSRLKRSHNMDAMVVPAWITEDTTGTLGRESKFLRLNILPCAVNGPFEETPAFA